jgi:prepilin-type N-terminal cleavage/methylation domain-containing protein/prepilin-type processing-associated H-X9-DG protein
MWRRRAFTLVELLVVIGIIATLVAILLPALSKARQQGNCLACQANLRSIGQAIQIYVQDSKGILPYGYWDGSFNMQTGQDLGGFFGSGGADWTVLLQSCIAGGGANFNAMTPDLKSKVRGTFMDPDAPQDGNSNAQNYTLVQYTCHPRLMPQLGQLDLFKQGTTSTFYFLTPYKIGHIKRSSEIAMIFDAVVVPATGGGWSTPHFQPVAQTLDNGQIDGPDYLVDSLDPGGSIDMSVTGTNLVNMDALPDGQNIRFRHMNNRVCNALMADFHVEIFTMQSDGSNDLLRSHVYVNP